MVHVGPADNFGSELLRLSHAVLEVADEHCRHVQQSQRQCNALLQCCHGLVFEAGRRPKLHKVSSSAIEQACVAVRDCVAGLSEKSLAWFLLNQAWVRQGLGTTETILADALTRLNINVERLHADLAEARQQDRSNLGDRLRSLIGNIADIEEGLRAGGRRRFRLEELATAFTKHVRTLGNATDDDRESAEIDFFLRTATVALQHLSGRSPDYEIPKWCVTSFDVNFDAVQNRLVGRGAFGRIFKGEWKGQAVAVKQMCSQLADEKAIQSIRHEVQVWSRLVHPNILPFYGACLEATKPFIVSKLCQRGNALVFLQSNPDADRIRLLHDVTAGMVYLHNQGVIHGDLKASNILVGDDGEAYIADFGLSQIQDQVSSAINVTRISAEKVRGTLRWMAPEVLEGKGLNKPADVYGFALTAWELYTDGGVPFARIPDEDLFRTLVSNRERPERPTRIEEDLWVLIKSCWASDPCERPDFIRTEKILGSLMGHCTKDLPRYALDDSRRQTSTSHTKSKRGKQKSATVTWHLPTVTVAPEDGPTPSFLKALATKRLFSIGKNQKLTGSQKSRPEHDATKVVESSAILALSRGLIDPHTQTLSSLARILADPPGPYRLDTVLVFLYNLSLTSEGVSQIVSETSLITALLRRLMWPDIVDKEKGLVLSLLANMACHGNARSVLISEFELMPALASTLSPSASLATQGNATRCLYNLSTNDDSHSLMVGQEGVVSVLARLLSCASPPEQIQNIVGCLTNLSHKEPGRSAILSTADVVPALIKILSGNEEDRTVEQALMCLGNLSVDEKSVKILATHPSLIHGLSVCLSRSPTAPIKSQALRCLRNLAKSAITHQAIIKHRGIMTTISDVLSSRTSSNQQRYVLHLLHRLSASGLQGELAGCSASLQWFKENGSPEEKIYATSCLGGAAAEPLIVGSLFTG